MGEKDYQNPCSGRMGRDEMSGSDQANHDPPPAVLSEHHMSPHASVLEVGMGIPHTQFGRKDYGRDDLTRNG
jgi:hypothetical protein